MYKKSQLQQQLCQLLLQTKLLKLRLKEQNQLLPGETEGEKNEKVKKPIVESVEEPGEPRPGVVESFRLNEGYMDGYVCVP